MKLGLLILTFLTFFNAAKISKEVLCEHSWKVDNIKIIKGTNDPNSKLPISDFYNKPPLCGQIITFNTNTTCQVQNKGLGGLNEVEKYNWSIDSAGNLKFRNKDTLIFDQFYLRVLSFNNDSIIFYSPSIGIETGNLSVIIYTLKQKI